jgi:hypothetical protein
MPSDQRHSMHHESRRHQRRPRGMPIIGVALALALTVTSACSTYGTTGSGGTTGASGGAGSGAGGVTTGAGGGSSSGAGTPSILLPSTGTPGPSGAANPTSPPSAGQGGPQATRSAGLSDVGSSGASLTASPSPGASPSPLVIPAVTAGEPPLGTDTRRAGSRPAASSAGRRCFPGQRRRHRQTAPALIAQAAIQQPVVGQATCQRHPGPSARGVARRSAIIGPLTTSTLGHRCRRSGPLRPCRSERSSGEWITPP